MNAALGRRTEGLNRGRTPAFTRSLRALLLLLPAVAALSGCGGWMSAASSAINSSHALFSISPGVTAIDTNCTGCNRGVAQSFAATLASGAAAEVLWSLPAAGNYGAIDAATGRYTPPAYLSADSLQVPVTASLRSNPAETATATITVTPGFLQPLTPENFAVGASGTVRVTGYLAEAGGTAGVTFRLADTPSGTGSGQGSLSVPECTRSNEAFTYCTVTYTAPAAVAKPAAVYIVASPAGSQSREAALVLLNTAGVESTPAGHQQQAGTGIALGSSGGNNNDYDTRNGNIADCCSGTLGALLQDARGVQYLLGNNHVLARTDRAGVGEAIVQPGLIDSSCTPYPAGKVTPVGVLTGWVPIKSAATNVDAAIAQVNSGAVNPSGAILELGERQANGTLASAPPGISSSGGRGEAAALNMSVAKSGRTTGLTCGGVSALSLDVKVSYFSDCAETRPYYTKTYTNQIGIAGRQFSDAGDSGALVVNAGNAEPVGLFFAGGEDSAGMGQGVANPAGEVLSDLSAHVGNGASYTFVGGADHPVSCMNYGVGAASAQTKTLTDAEQARGELALAQARVLVNPSEGVYSVVLGKSSDNLGEAAVVVYVDPNTKTSIPATVGGVRTVVVATTMQTLAAGTAPLSPADDAALQASALRSAIAIKQQVSAGLLKRNPSYFGVGVGQSYDNPREAALVVYVDRAQVPARLPQTIRGLRTRYIVMERLHVTRSYLSASPAQSHCAPHAAQSAPLDIFSARHLRELNLFR